MDTDAGREGIASHHRPPCLAWTGGGIELLLSPAVASHQGRSFHGTYPGRDTGRNTGQGETALGAWLSRGGLAA